MGVEMYLRRFFLYSILAALTLMGIGPHQALGASELEIKGKLEISVIDNFQEGTSETHYYVHDEITGRVTRLLNISPEEASRLSSGDKVIVKGRTSKDNADRTVTVESISKVTDGSALIQLNKLSTELTDSRTVGIIMVTLNDGVPCDSAARVSSLIFGATKSVKDLYEKNTHGRISFDGDLNGDGSPDVYHATVNMSGRGTCDHHGWASAADDAVEAQGHDLSEYRHLIYILPANTGCSWGGVAHGSRASVRQSQLIVYAHEIGHLLGMGHAGTDVNNDGVHESEYGDWSSMMGNGPAVHMNGPNYVGMGLIGANVQDGVVGNFTLAPLASAMDTLFPQVIRIPKPNTGEYYFLSYRRPEGYDSVLATKYTRGVSVHTAMYNGRGFTKFVKALAVGETFSDPGTGMDFHVTAQASDASSISFSVSGSCSRVAPTIRASPDTRYTGAAGRGAYYVTIKNNDGTLCPATRFHLSATFPGGVTGSFGQTEFTVSPGNSVSTSLSVVSTVVGTQTFSLKLRDIGGG
ncbi:MAG: hypothetical protein AB7G93_20700 [Bdellovibrionales bacterium]